MHFNFLGQVSEIFFSLYGKLVTFLGKYMKFRLSRKTVLLGRCENFFHLKN